MNTYAKTIKNTKVSSTLLNKLISSIIFAFIIVFLILNTIQSLGIDAEISFIKQWLGLTILIFIWKKLLT